MTQKKRPPFTRIILFLKKLLKVLLDAKKAPSAGAGKNSNEKELDAALDAGN